MLSSPAGRPLARLGLRVVFGIILLGWLLSNSAVAHAGSAFAVFVGGGGLLITAKGAAAGVAAGGFLALSSGSANTELPYRYGGPTYLIVDAMPFDAQVFLDGRHIGMARDLLARALPLDAGWHAIEISAPTFRPYTVRFAVRPGGFPIRVRTILVPEHKVGGAKQSADAKSRVPNGQAASRVSRPVPQTSIAGPPGNSSDSP